MTTYLAVNNIVDKLIEAGKKKVKSLMFLDLTKVLNIINHKT